MWQLAIYYSTFHTFETEPKTHSNEHIHLPISCVVYIYRYIHTGFSVATSCFLVLDYQRVIQRERHGASKVWGKIGDTGPCRRYQRDWMGKKLLPNSLLAIANKNHKSQREHWFYWNLSSLKLRYPLKIGLPNQKVVSQPLIFRGFIVHLSLSLKTYGPISAKPTSVGKGIFKAATHCIDPKENGLWCWRTRGHTSLPVLEHFEVSCGLFWTSLCLDITYVHQRRNTAMYVHIQYIIQYMLLNTRLEHVSLYFQLNLLNWSLKFVFKHRFTVDIPYSNPTANHNGV